MAHPSLILIGGGGHALVVADAAISGKEPALDLAGFFDDNPAARLGPLFDCQRLGAFCDLPALKLARAQRAILAIGEIQTRREVLGLLAQFQGAAGGAAAFGSVIHPTAHLARHLTLGCGLFVGPHAVVHTAAVLSDHVIINTGAIVEHECRIGENTHIAPGAVLGGNVHVGRDCLIGLGSRVLPGIVIGDGCVIGAGAVVTKDVPTGATLRGVPARR